MRANYKLKRLRVNSTLTEGAQIVPDAAQTHYLLHVLRMRDGDELLLFNGVDGEWRAMASDVGKRVLTLVCRTQEREQPDGDGPHLFFAPIKAGRLDYMVQKAVEMGVSRLVPVLTEFTQNHRFQSDKAEAWITEAAEQCGVLSIPTCDPAISFDAMVANLPADRTLLFCDEDHAMDNPVATLQTLRGKAISILIGPEGGFSDAERDKLRSHPQIVPIALGPRILRADTAAVAALTLVQSILGDW